MEPIPESYDLPLTEYANGPKTLSIPEYGSYVGIPPELRDMDGSVRREPDDDELDSLRTVRDLQYNRHAKEENLVNALELALLLYSPLRAIGRKIVPRPVPLKNGTRPAYDWFEDNLVRKPRHAKVPLTDKITDAQRAAEYYAENGGLRPGEEIVNTRIPKTPVDNIRKLNLNSLQDGSYSIKPGKYKNTAPADYADIKILTPEYKVSPHFENMPKRSHSEALKNWYYDSSRPIPYFYEE